MLRTITLDCQCDKNNNNLFGKGFFPNEMCSETICVNKKTFKSFGRSDYQWPQSKSTCQLRHILFEQQTVSFFLKCDQTIYMFEETRKSIQDAIGDVYCPTCPNEKCVYLSNNRNFSSYDC